MYYGDDAWLVATQLVGGTRTFGVHHRNTLVMTDIQPEKIRRTMSRSFADRTAASGRASFRQFLCIFATIMLWLLPQRLVSQAPGNKTVGAALLESGKTNGSSGDLASVGFLPSPVAVDGPLHPVGEDLLGHARPPDLTGLMVDTESVLGRVPLFA